MQLFLLQTLLYLIDVPDHRMSDPILLGGDPILHSFLLPP